MAKAKGMNSSEINVHVITHSPIDPSEDSFWSTWKDGAVAGTVGRANLGWHAVGYDAYTAADTLDTVCPIADAIVVTVPYASGTEKYEVMDDAINRCIAESVPVFTANTDTYHNDDVIAYIGSSNYQMGEKCALSLLFPTNPDVVSGRLNEDITLPPQNEFDERFQVYWDESNELNEGMKQRLHGLENVFQKFNRSLLTFLPKGRPDCPCVDDYGPDVPTDDGLIISINGSNYEYPPRYGLSTCSPHDRTLTPFCDPLGLETYPSAHLECAKKWCYVDINNCHDDVTTRNVSSLAGYSWVEYPGKELHYSYDTCGSVDNYYNFLNKETISPSLGIVNNYTTSIVMSSDWAPKFSANNSKVFVCGDEVYNMPNLTQYGQSPFTQGLSAVASAVSAAFVKREELEWKAFIGNSGASMRAESYHNQRGVMKLCVKYKDVNNDNKIGPITKGKVKCWDDDTGGPDKEMGHADLDNYGCAYVRWNHHTCWDCFGWWGREPDAFCQVTFETPEKKEMMRETKRHRSVNLDGSFFRFDDIIVNLSLPRRDKNPKPTWPVETTNRRDLCPRGNQVSSIGELHSADMGNDHYCIVQENGRDDATSKQWCEPDDERAQWAFCPTGHIVNVKTKLCLEYHDSWFWDQIKVRSCKDDDDHQKFDKIVDVDLSNGNTGIRDMAVKTPYVIGSKTTTLRTEFRLKAKSGHDHCLSGMDCWGIFGCYLGADYCRTENKHYFFLKDKETKKRRFDEGDEGYEYPTLYEEAKEAITAAKLVYAFTYIRYALDIGMFMKNKDNRRDDSLLSTYFKSSITWNHLEEKFFVDKTTDNFLENDFQIHTSYKDLQNILNEEFIEGLEENEHSLDMQFLHLKNWLNLYKDGNKWEKMKIVYFSYDKPKDTPLAYFIIVDEDNKRIAITIKGSEGDGPVSEREHYFNDWGGKNAECDETENADYRLFLDEKKPQTHPGYSHAVDGNYDNIVKVVKKLFNKSESQSPSLSPSTSPTGTPSTSPTSSPSDYKLYIFGHSMGGATATLLGVRMALDLYKEDITGIPKPISIVTVAAPQVGDDQFRKVNNILEREGYLRNLRIEAQMDIVPDTAGGSAPGLSGALCYIDPRNVYKKVGLEIHLNYIDNIIPGINNWVNHDTEAIEYNEVRFAEASSQGVGRRLFRGSECAKPCNFSGELEFLDNDLLNCKVSPLSCWPFWHSPEAYLAAMYCCMNDNDLYANDEYEKYLG